MADNLDESRRRFLGIATGATGAVGGAMLAVPFLGSLVPSKRAQALGAPVEVNIANLDVGQMVRKQWRGRTVYVARRDKQMLKRIEETTPMLRDPESTESEQPQYATGVYRSLKPEFLVIFGQCTHLGCAPTQRFEVGPPDLGEGWLGGFFCACHGSKFDMAGRVFKGVPAPLNLPVPPYRFIGESVIEIGTDTGAA